MLERRVRTRNDRPERLTTEVVAIAAACTAMHALLTLAFLSGGFAYGIGEISILRICSTSAAVGPLV